MWKQFPLLLIAVSMLFSSSIWGSEHGEEGFVSPPIGLPKVDIPSQNDYQALRKASPFLRTLDFSETYALRGVASFADQHFATLYNRETKKTILVTADGDNEYGLTLVNVVPSSQLAGVKARVSFAGEVTELQYDSAQMNPDAKAISAKSSRPEGERKGPSDEDRRKFESLSEEKKKKFREYIGKVMKKYHDLPHEKRREMIREALNRVVEGKSPKGD